MKPLLCKGYPTRSIWANDLLAKKRGYDIPIGTFWDVSIHDHVPSKPMHMTMENLKPGTFWMRNLELHWLVVPRQPMRTSLKRNYFLVKSNRI